jgi:hypothetical protein
VASKVLASIEVAGSGLACCLGGLLTIADLWWLVSNYGEHTYSCGGKRLPCLTYSKVDDPYAIVGLALLLSILLLLVLATGLHARTHRTLWLFVLLGLAGVYWIILILSFAIFVTGFLFSALVLLVGCLAAVASQMLRRVDALTAS